MKLGLIILVVCRKFVMTPHQWVNKWQYLLFASQLWVCLILQHKLKCIWNLLHSMSSQICCTTPCLPATARTRDRKGSWDTWGEALGEVSGIRFGIIGVSKIMDLSPSRSRLSGMDIAWFHNSCAMVFQVGESIISISLSHVGSSGWGVSLTRFANQRRRGDLVLQDRMKEI